MSCKYDTAKRVCIYIYNHENTQHNYYYLSITAVIMVSISRQFFIRFSKYFILDKLS